MDRMAFFKEFKEMAACAAHSFGCRLRAEERDGQALFTASKQGRDLISIRAEACENSVFLKNAERFAISPEEREESAALFWLLAEAMEDIGKKRGAEAMVIYRHAEAGVFETAKLRGYAPMTAIEQRVWEKRNRSFWALEGDWLKELKAGEMSRACAFFEAVSEALRELKEEDVTIHWGEKKLGDLERIAFYCYGYEGGMLEAKCENGEAKISEANNEFLRKLDFWAFERSEVKAAVKELFEKIKKDQRIRNALRFNKYHFRRFMKRVAHSEKARRQIYDAMLARYKRGEIEEKIAEQLDKTDKSYLLVVPAMDKGSVNVFQIGELIFVTDTLTEPGEQTVKCFSSDEKEKAMRALEELMALENKMRVNKYQKFVDENFDFQN